MVIDPVPSYVDVTVAPSPFPNHDLLAWFDEDEKEICVSCGERTAVSLPDVIASFCLACGAVSIDGVRIDSALRIAG